MKENILLFLILSTSALAGHAQVQNAQVPTHFVTSSDGTLIALHESGPANGEPIVFLHGFSANGNVWFQQQSSPALSKYRIVTMDLRGHGYSGKPADPGAYANPTLFADDVNAVIQQLNLHRPALVGWSVGAGVIMFYLQKFGDSFISGVDIVDSIASPNATISQQASEQAKNAPFIPPLISNDAPTNFAGTVSDANLIASGSPTSSGPLTPDQQLILEDILYSAPVFVRQNYVNGVGAAITTDFGALLASLTVPVLLQGAKNDPIFPQTLLIPLEAALIKHPTVKLYETGAHIPFILIAELFNSDLAAWLETLQF
jgi:pimeloyl-ACP methyl ester carboxylesterase